MRPPETVTAFLNLFLCFDYEVSNTTFLVIHSQDLDLHIESIWFCYPGSHIQHSLHYDFLVILMRVCSFPGTEKFI